MTDLETTHCDICNKEIPEICVFFCNAPNFETKCCIDCAQGREIHPSQVIKVSQETWDWLQKENEREVRPEDLSPALLAAFREHATPPLRKKNQQ